MPQHQDFGGPLAPKSRERVEFLRDADRYVQDWERALGAGAKPPPPLAAHLNHAASALQRRAPGLGFGGLGHHIAEFTRLLDTGCELSAVRGQLSIVSELFLQARHTLTTQELTALTSPEAPLEADPASLAPPRLITMARPLDAAMVASLKAATSASGQPLASGPVAFAPAGVNPASAPAQFGVKNMLGLRAFNREGGGQPAGRQPAGAPPLGLPGLPASGGPSPLGSPSLTPPRFVADDASGLPRLERDPPLRTATPSRQSDEILARMRPGRASGRERRSDAPPARGTPAPRRPMPRGRAADTPGRGALWAGVAGVAALVCIALVAFLTLVRRPARAATEAAASVSSADAAESATVTTAAKSGAEMPRERLLADNERFAALLAQVHGHGGTESPELRSLLNDQAALASKALSGKCKDGSATCKAWSDIRELMVGDHNQPIVKRRRGSDTETTRSHWMAGLKMPGIPVEDDPRVLRVFEFYTENPVGRETFQSMLFRCGAYRDLIQSTLIRYDLPPDLMALVFTESGCEPSAKSPVGAAGLWQFMPETGRAYHLRVVDGTIDERYSPFKSTEAGIRMLADLRQKLGSWDLVFASYNLGPFGVLARVERAGGDASFWDLVDADLLPDETANYSPTVEAIALILANLQRLKFAGIQIRAPQLTADLEVPGGTRLGLVARAAATSVTQLRALNLDFSGDVVPLIPGGAIAVQVPKDVVWQARDTMKELLASKDGADQCVPPTFDWGKQRFTPEMDGLCQKRLAAGVAAVSAEQSAAAAKP